MVPPYSRLHTTSPPSVRIASRREAGKLERSERNLVAQHGPENISLARTLASSTRCTLCRAAVDRLQRTIRARSAVSPTLMFIPTTAAVVFLPLDQDPRGSSIRSGRRGGARVGPLARHPT